jgi:branched-chain amino acid aminotransferase
LSTLLRPRVGACLARRIESMVRTFEITDGRARETDPAATLTEASSHLPEGVYTTLRTYGRDRVLRFHDHVRRLEDSAALQGRPARLDEGALRSGLAGAVAAAGHPESRLRVTWAAGRLFAAVEPFTPLPTALYESGVACATLPVRRDNPHAKDTRFLETARAAYGSLPEGVHEGLLLGEDGAVLEGLSSNFFAVHAGLLRTEAERVLPGVTRSVVLEVTRGVLALLATPVDVAQLGEISESFITSASRGILPVVQVDQVTIGPGRPGAITRQLRARFEGLVQCEAKPLLGGQDRAGPKS